MDKIFLRPGMRLLEVEAQSRVQLPLQKLRDNSSVVVEKPVQICYFGGPASFELPPTLTVWISQLGGTVVNFELAPQLEGLEIAAARKLAVEVADRIGRAGWLAQDATWHAVPTVAEISSAFDSRRKEALFSRLLGRWQLGSVKLELTLKMLLAEGSDHQTSLADGHFLVNLYAFDDELWTAQRRRVVERRKAASGREDDPLPLSAWIGER